MKKKKEAKQEVDLQGNMFGLKMYRPLLQDKAYRVQVNLMDILEINEEKKYVRCEPLVTVQRLVEALKPKGKSLFI